MEQKNKIIVYGVVGSILCAGLWETGEIMKVKAAQKKAADPAAAAREAVGSWGPEGDPVIGKSPEEVLGVFGEPEARRDLGQDMVWYYLRSDGWKNGPLSVEVHIAGGRVLSTLHQPQVVMEDLIATARLVPQPRHLFPRTRRYEAEEFRSAVQGRTREQLRSDLGEPEGLEVIRGEETWTYQGVVLGPDGSLHDRRLILRDGTVAEIREDSAGSTAQ